MAITIDEFLKTLESSATQTPERIAALRDVLQAGQAERNGKASGVNGTAGHGIQIGPCQILSATDTDRTGVTFLGQHCENGQEMSVRMVFPNIDRPFGGTEEEQIARQNYSHPSQTPILAVEQVGEFLCLCRDAANGESLTSIVAESGAFPIDAATECMLQATRCLHDAHEAGYVNGEIGANQWVLDDDGQLLLNPDQAFLRINSISDAGTRLAADRESLRSLWILLSLGMTESKYWGGCILSPIPEPFDMEFWNQAETVRDVLAKLDPTAVPTPKPLNGTANGAVEHHTPSADVSSPITRPAEDEPATHQSETNSTPWTMWLGVGVALLSALAWWLSR